MVITKEEEKKRKRRREVEPGYTPRRVDQKIHGARKSPLE
jgi:hypothetical protein